MDTKVTQKAEVMKESSHTALEIFENSEFGQVRTIIDKEGNPWFCLPDSCKILGIKDPSSAKRRLSESGVQLIDTHAPYFTQGDKSVNRGGNTMTTFINEFNLYKLIMRSNAPFAEKFQDWICGDVLPTLRKHGIYVVGLNQNSYGYDDVELRAIAWAKEHKALRTAVEDNKRLEAENRRMKPKENYYDIFMNSESMIGIREYAYQLGITENELVNYLIGGGYLYREVRNRKKPLKIRKPNGYVWFRYCDAVDNNKFGSKIMINPAGKAAIFNILCNEGIVSVDNIRL